MNVLYKVAVVGASSLAGEAIIELLSERQFPIDELFPLESSDEAGKRIEFNGKHVLIGELEPFDFSTVQIAFFAGNETVSESFAPLAAEAGCVVIDCSGRFSQDLDVPLVVAEVNPYALEDFRQRQMIASPRGTTVLMAVVIKALATRTGVRRINLMACEAVSEAGHASVKALAGETANLLNGRPLESPQVSVQQTFNLIPQVGTLLEGGYSSAEMQVINEMQRLFGPELGVNATLVQAPVFFGHALTLHIETEDPVSAELAGEWLRLMPDVVVLDESENRCYATPVEEAGDGNRICVGRIREDISHPTGLDLWVVADNIRRGIAKNGVQIAEILVKEHL